MDIMSFLIICIVIAALLLTGAFILISKTPPEFLGTIQKQIPVSVSKVWDYIADIEGTPLRKTEIKKIEVLERKDSGIFKWKEYTDMGGYMLFEKTEEPLKKIEKRMIDSSFGMTGTWLYEIQGNEDLSVVTIPENSKTIKPLVKLMLVLSGRDANLKREMKIIENFAKTKY